MVRAIMLAIWPGLSIFLIAAQFWRRGLMTLFVRQFMVLFYRSPVPWLG
jgi:hypothetical protein